MGSNPISPTSGSPDSTPLPAAPPPSGGEELHYDPGLFHTATCRSSLSSIDAAAGALEYCGYPVEQLAASCCYEEVAWLLLHGELPSRRELQDFQAALAARQEPPPELRRAFSAFAPRLHPMAMLGAGLALLGGRGHREDSAALRHGAALELLALTPALAAWSWRRHQDLPLTGASQEGSYAGRLLAQLRGGESGPVDPRLVRVLDALLILHADLEQNCSTHTVRSIGSTAAGAAAALAGGAAALSGPLHGGASQRVMDMLDEIGEPGRVAAFLASCREGKRRLMGFGHRIYRSYDPRARCIQGLAAQLYAGAAANPRLEIARELERQAAGDAYFRERGLHPNVDFYSGLVYQALGLAPPLFPVLFAAGRMAGWLAQWLEARADPEQRLVSPRQLYAGPPRRDFVPLELRVG